MSRRKRLVLDADILLRAVCGQRVRELLETYEEEVTFYSPDVCFEDARKYIPDISGHRRINPAIGLTVLDEVSHLVETRLDPELLATADISAAFSASRLKN